MSLLFTSVVSASAYNEKNEDVLGRLLEINDVEYESIEITNEKIRVTIESSNASEYDTQLIAWWGLIFANAGLLEGEDQAYKYIIIQTNINREPIAYVSANRASVLDLMEGRIDDAMFWDEVSINPEEPSPGLIEANSFLPPSALNTNTRESILSKNTNGNNNSKWLLWIIILIIIAAIVVGLYKFPKESGQLLARAKKHTQKTSKRAKELYDTKGKHIIHDISTKAKETGKVIGEKSKKFSKQAKHAAEKHSKQLKETTKKRLEEFKEAAKEDKKQKKE